MITVLNTIMSLFVLICVQAAALQQNSDVAIPNVVHTEYVSAHQHATKSLKRIADSNVLPFKSLFQLYEFEFVPHTKKEVTPDGLYEQDIWSSQGFDIYILYCGETPIGLAVVNLASMVTGDVSVKDIAEFFVMPSHRRQGCGRWFAHAIFDLYPGQWEIREVPNHPAIRNFWCETIRAYVGDKFTDIDMDSEGWVGPLQTFNTKDHGSILA